MIISRGEGVRIFDENGKGYIESVARLWCVSLGFANERLVQAAANQMRQLPFYHSSTGKSHMPMIDLAEMLIEQAPVPMSKVFFAKSGSEANDTAIRMVRYFNDLVGRPEMKKLTGRVKGYHGITLAASSLTGLPTIIAASTCRLTNSCTLSRRISTMAAGPARRRNNSPHAAPTNSRS